METVRLSDIRHVLECPRRQQLMARPQDLAYPRPETRLLHALRHCAWKWMSGEIDKGSDLYSYYYSLWPEKTSWSREEQAACERGVGLLTAWFRLHKRRALLSDGVLGLDESLTVQYHGLRVHAPLDLRWRKGDIEEYVLLFLEPVALPEANLLVHHVWHHILLHGKRAHIMLYNFAQNCYARVEVVNPDLYPQAVKTAGDLLRQGASYPTFAGCGTCRVASRCLKHEAIL